MSKISYKDLDHDLQGSLDSKPGRGFTIFVAALASFILPLLLMLAKDWLIDRPKEKVYLTYYVVQPEFHPKKEYITVIEIENIGQKATGQDPIILDVIFDGIIKDHEWRKDVPKENLIQEIISKNKYTLKLKSFGPGASCSKLLKTEKDLKRLPTLTYNAVLYHPRKLKTHRKFDMLTPKIQVDENS